jgi:hypothetical protein
VSLSCWKSGTSMAIPIRPQGARGPKGILLYPIGGNLSNCERGLRVSVVPNKRKPMAKQDMRAGVNLSKGM